MESKKKGNGYSVNCRVLLFTCGANLEGNVTELLSQPMNESMRDRLKMMTHRKTCKVYSKDLFTY